MSLSTKDISIGNDAWCSKLNISVFWLNKLYFRYTDTEIVFELKLSGCHRNTMQFSQNDYPNIIKLNKDSININPL